MTLSCLSSEPFQRAFLLPSIPREQKYKEETIRLQGKKKLGLNLFTIVSFLIYRSSGKVVSFFHSSRLSGGPDGATSKIAFEIL